MAKKRKAKHASSRGCCCRGPSNKGKESKVRKLRRLASAGKLKKKKK